MRENTFSTISERHPGFEDSALTEGMEYLTEIEMLQDLWLRHRHVLDDKFYVSTSRLGSWFLVKAYTCIRRNVLCKYIQTGFL